MIRCTQCRRPLRDTADAIRARGGRVNVGPVCAERLGLARAPSDAVRQLRRVARGVAVVDERQMELLEVAC